MLEKYLILILLPTVVYSGIKIQIEPIKNGTDASVQLFGEETTDVSDSDRKVFKIDDGTLKKASEKYMGKRCGDVYVKPPTPWGNVFEQYGWEIVTKTVKPIVARVIGINSKPVAFGHAEYVNNHDSLNVTYSTSLTHQVEETVSHAWSQGGEVSAGMEIQYGVNFGIASAGGTASLSYTATWGKETTKSREVMLSSSSSVAVILPPHHIVIASLLATEGKMDIEIKYKSKLDGRVFCNYPDKFEGHYFYSMPIKPLLKSINLSVEKESIERISIGYYSTVRLVVSNSTAIN